MKNLKVIENELVPVYITSTGEKVVYGTELHKVLDVKSRFNDWIGNRLNDCEAIENEDFETFTKNLVKGRPTIEYVIKLDTAKEMAMLERNEIGKQVRRYFINIEHRYKEAKKAAALPSPLNPVIASSVADLGRVTERIMKNQGSPAYKIAEVFKSQCEQFGIQMPDDFVNVPEYEQLTLSTWMFDQQSSEGGTQDSVRKS